MTYPVDDAGNPRVDFAWGNMPMQPNQQRQGRNTGNKYINDGWMVSPAVGSDNLVAGWDMLNRNAGDGYYEELTRFRADMVIYDSHEIAIDEYNGFPGLNYESPYGDLIPNATMPNLAGLTPQQAGTAIANAGITGSVGSINQTSGATSGNNGKIVAGSQSPAAGAVVNVDTTVTYALYTYVSPSTGPINTLVNPLDVDLTEATDAWMYLLGRTVKPTVGDFINIDGSTQNMYNNNNFEVMSVANDDVFNTGGTKVKIRSTTGNLGSVNLTATGGTWTKL